MRLIVAPGRVRFPKSECKHIFVPDYTVFDPKEIEERLELSNSLHSIYADNSKPSINLIMHISTLDDMIPIISEFDGANGTTFRFYDILGYDSKAKCFDVTTNVLFAKENEFSCSRLIKHKNVSSLVNDVYYIKFNEAILDGKTYGEARELADEYTDNSTLDNLINVSYNRTNKDIIKTSYGACKGYNIYDYRETT